MMKIEVTLIEVGENEALVFLEADEWVVGMPLTLADPKATIDTDILESPNDVLALSKRATNWIERQPYFNPNAPDLIDKIAEATGIIREVLGHTEQLEEELEQRANRIRWWADKVRELRDAIRQVRQSDNERNYAYGRVDWSPVDNLKEAK